MRTACIFVAGITLVGCTKPALRLAADGTKNLEAVSTYVPVGTDRTGAVELMSKAGFTCRVVENGVVTDVTPKEGASKLMGKTISVILCDQQGESAASTHQVILYLDSSGRVARHGVSSGPAEK